MTNDQLAKKLFLIKNHGVLALMASHELENGDWNVMSVYVQRLILEAKIEALEGLGTGLFDSTPYKDETIKGFRKELEALNG